MLKKIILFLFFAVLTASIFAQTGSPMEDPASAVSLGSIEALTAALTLIITYFSGLIPGLKNVKSGVVRAIAVGVVVVLATVQFKFGWLSKESVDALFAVLVPTFAYSGFVWEILKSLLSLLKIDLKATMPTGGN